MITREAKLIELLTAGKTYKDAMIEIATWERSNRKPALDKRDNKKGTGCYYMAGYAVDGGEVNTLKGYMGKDALCINKQAAEWMMACYKDSAMMSAIQDIAQG